MSAGENWRVQARGGAWQRVATRGKSWRRVMVRVVRNQPYRNFERCVGARAVFDGVVAFTVL